MHNKSMALHNTQKNQLETKIKNLKYTVKDLENLLFYV